MPLRLPFVTLTVLAMSALASAGPIPAGDILIGVDAGKLVTSLIAEDQSFVVPGVRVFGAELGRSGVPFFADEPGFQIARGSFDPHALLGFDIVTSLERWNGDGFDPLDHLTSETMNISFADGAFSVTTGGGFVPGFDLITDDGGGLHDHMDFTLLGPGDADPALGIYLLELRFRTSMAGIGASDPVWIVYNNGLSERDHVAAFLWAGEHLAPVPGAAPALGLFALTLRSRRRRRVGLQKVHGR